MKNQHKIYCLLTVLVLSITTVLVLNKPLYLALGLTTTIAWLGLKNKKQFSLCLPDNLKQIKLILLLMSLISITLPLAMASGTLPSLIYYMSNWMVGKNILLAAFLMGTFLSLILGSAIGTLTLIVPIFISLSIHGNLSLPMIVGALLSGTYFGDRASMLSSSVHLIAGVTQTNYRNNMVLLFKSSFSPYIITLIAYAFLGRNMNISLNLLKDNNVLFDYYNVNLWLLLPLIFMVVFLLFKAPILKALSVLTLSSFMVLLFKRTPALTFLKTTIYGYTSENMILKDFIATKGFLNMTQVLWVIILSAILNAILEADNLMPYIIAPFVKNIKNKNQLFHRTGWLSLIICMITCSQAMTAMITGKYMAPYYDKMSVDKSYLALSISNVGVNLVAMIPWNVNALMVLSITGVPTTSYFIFSIFLWLLSSLTLLSKPFKTV